MRRFIKEKQENRSSDKRSHNKLEIQTKKEVRKNLDQVWLKKFHEAPIVLVVKGQKGIDVIIGLMQAFFFLAS